MKKGKDFEADYFIREELASKHKLAKEHKREQQEAQKEELKALHFMKCPKCGQDLKSKRMTYVEVDQCGSCGALVIAADDVDRFVEEEKSILKSLIDFFK